MAFEYTLTELGKQMQAQNTPAPRMSTQGNYKFDWNQINNSPFAFNANGANNAAFEGSNSPWQQFNGADGTPLMAVPMRTNNGPIEGYQIIKATDFGGGWLGNEKESRLNGVARDYYDPQGNYQKSDVIQGVKDGGVMGPWGALAVIAMPFAAAAAGLGAGAAAGAAEGVAGAAGAAGAAEGAAGIGAGFIGDATAAGYAGLDAASAATLGGGASGAWGGGAAAAGAAGGAASVFNPAVDSQLASTQLGITGTQAAADAAATALPSVTLSNIASTNPGLWESLKAAFPSLASMASDTNLSTLGSLLGPAASIVGGYLNSEASGKAADAQLTATREAAALQEPFRQGGLKGLNRLLDLYGLSGNTAAEGYGSAQKKFGLADFQADPGYQFRQAEGEKGMQRAASAAGLLGSGKYLKDTMNFNQGLASQEYGKAYDRYGTDIARQINPLQALAGQGQTAANTIGEYTTQGGNAQAAGQVGKANALSGAITQGISQYQNQQYLNRLFPTSQGVSNPYVS